MNFSSIATDGNKNTWIGSFGHGLYIKKGDSLEVFNGYDSRQVLPTTLNIQTLHFDSKNRLWIGTYGSGAYLLDFKTQTISNFRVKPNNPKAIHYNDILCIYEDFTGTIWFGTDGAGLSYYDENLAKFNSLTNFEIPDFADVAVTRAITVDQNGGVWIGTSGKGSPITARKTQVLNLLSIILMM